MCSRFEVNAKPRDLARRFGFEDLPMAFTEGEVRPTNDVLTVSMAGAEILKWGLQVDWDTKPLINARAETLMEKRTFQPLLESRCLVPASAYFEWRRDGKARFKNRITSAGDDLFAFAGLSDGVRFTIVTTAPHPSVADIHNRMPVILAPSAEAAWIDNGLSYAEVSQFLNRDELMLEAEEEIQPPPRQPDLFG